MAPIKDAIVFEDTHLLVINKPAGLLSQGDHTGDTHLVALLQEYLGRPYVGLVHRLDRMTTGLLVVAKRTKSAERLTTQLQDGRLHRIYLAILEGELSGALLAPQRWEHYLLKNSASNHVTALSQERPGAKRAVLQVTLHRRIAPSTEFSRGLSLVQFELETGRSHQIRAQASAKTHPLLGDQKYGADNLSATRRPALHSWKMSFFHPMSQERLEFEAPWPADLARVCQPISGGISQEQPERSHL